MPHFLVSKNVLFYMLLSVLLLAYGCELSGNSPKKTLQTVAEAMEKNDVSLFVEQFDLKACAVSQITNVTESNEALSTLDHLGRTLGLGGMEDLLGNVFDVERSLRQNFRKKVSSGVLANECVRQDSSGCPWVPKSLRSAEVKTLSDKAAVARVRTPANVTTWIALVGDGKTWRIVGWADMEDLAGKFAQRESRGEKDVRVPNKGEKGEGSSTKEKKGGALTL